MVQKVKFCGGCGAPLKAGARFCGECGWSVPVVVKQVEKPAVQPVPVKPRPVAKPVAKPKVGKRPVDEAPTPPIPPDVRPKRSGFKTGIEWGVIWLIGWLPLGLYMGLFWMSSRERFRIYYDLESYAVSWGFTLPGALFSFAMAGLVGGFLAGVSYRMAVPSEPKGVLAKVSIPILWLIGWTVVLGVTGVFNYSTSAVSDDMLILVSFASAPVFAIILAQLALLKRSVGRISMTRRILMSLGWAVSALVGFAGALILIWI